MARQVPFPLELPSTDPVSLVPVTLHEGNPPARQPCECLSSSATGPLSGGPLLQGGDPLLQPGQDRHPRREVSDVGGVLLDLHAELVHFGGHLQDRHAQLAAVGPCRSPGRPASRPPSRRSSGARQGRSPRLGFDPPERPCSSPPPRSSGGSATRSSRGSPATRARRGTSCSPWLASSLLRGTVRGQVCGWGGRVRRAQPTGERGRGTGRVARLGLHLHPPIHVVDTEPYGSV